MRRERRIPDRPPDKQWRDVLTYTGLLSIWFAENVIAASDYFCPDIYLDSGSFRVNRCGLIWTRLNGEEFPVCTDCDDVIAAYNRWRLDNITLGDG